MAILTPTGLADTLRDHVVNSPARWMDDLLGEFEGTQDRMTALRLSSGSETPLLAVVPGEVPGFAYFGGTADGFAPDARADEFLLSGFEPAIGGDWNDLAVSAGLRSGRGFDNPAVQARLEAGFDREIPGVAVDLPSPEVWPGASDDDFLLAKDTDLPQVLPGVEDFDFSVTRMSSGDQPTRWTSHMLSFSEGGFLLGPTDDPGRPHDFDDWLF